MHRENAYLADQKRLATAKEAEDLRAAAAAASKAAADDVATSRAAFDAAKAAEKRAAADSAANSYFGKAQNAAAQVTPNPSPTNAFL